MAFDIEYKPEAVYEARSNSTIDISGADEVAQAAPQTIEATPAEKAATNVADVEYRPDSGYEETFYTTAGDDGGGNPAAGPGDSAVLDKLNDMKKKLDSLYTMAQGLPDMASETLTGTLSGISYITGLFNPDFVKNPDLSSIDVTINDSSDYAGGDSYTSADYDIELPDDIFPDFDDAQITVTDGDTDSVRIEKEFATDLTNIFVDYVNKLNSSLSGYYVKFISAVGEAGMYGKYKQLLKPISTGARIQVSPGQQMLLDSVVKNEIVGDQKMRLQKKLYNTAGFVSAARSAILSKELRRRYYAMDYVVETSFADMNRNKMLSDMRLSYDAKYEKSLYDLYKYLNSSVILLNETLALQAATCEAKAALINEGVSL
jgi:hypothetical protein